MYNGNSRPIYQVCGKIGHIAAYCNYRYNKNYMETIPNSTQKNQHTTLVASVETLGDPTWYGDSGASNHVTNDVANLNQKQDYNGKESLIVGNAIIQENR
ncbi:hypothetical protein UlMin_014178 [Ulmus minor]